MTISKVILLKLYKGVNVLPRHELSPFEKNIRRIIAQNLKAASRNITQAELAGKTGIPTSTLSGYFAQRSTPSPANVEKLATALGIHKSAIDPRFDEDLLDNNINFEAIFAQLSPQRQRSVLMYAKQQLQAQLAGLK